MSDSKLTVSTPVRLTDRCAPAPAPDRPRNCVRIYPVIGGYLLVAFDPHGTAIREARTGPETWEEVFDEVEAFRQRHVVTALTVIG